MTRYADVILSEAFPDHWDDLRHALDSFHPTFGELRAAGGNRTPFVARFDASLEARGWGKRSVDIGKLIDGELVTAVRGHEIDMFRARSGIDRYPGVGCEMEWNNKDPFFDRDLLNFQSLHREGVLAVGVLVTRGPTLQDVVKRTIGPKFGESTTHWRKLVERVNLGGGGECPLLVVGIEPRRITGFEGALDADRALSDNDDALRNWREGPHASYAAAKAAHQEAQAAVLGRLDG